MSHRIFRIFSNSRHLGSSDDVASRLRLVRDLESGQLERLDCPGCNTQAVSVWFSHPRETVYRTWFVCSNCSFRMRTQNSTRPKFYCDERLSHELDVYDDRLLKLTRVRSGDVDRILNANSINVTGFPDFPDFTRHKL